MPSRGRTDEFPRLLGGRLCLDFVNTIEDPFGAAEEFLHGYEDLVRWGGYADAFDGDEARALREHGVAQPDHARLVFAEALRLRASLERIFRAIAAGEQPPDKEMEELQQDYAKAVSVAVLAPLDRRLEWSWPSASDLKQPLWLIVQSAMELLTEGDLRRVKQCPGANDCGWLFYDTSRNSTRRWCSMEGCGSRVKMRRHYARHKRQCR
jgi:predicted RNA-binding Zn ribbon-like protein